MLKFDLVYVCRVDLKNPQTYFPLGGIYSQLSVLETSAPM